MLQEDFELSWDKALLQFDRIHRALRMTYWSPRIRRDLVERAASNNLCLGAYDRRSREQVAYARVITDCATIAYISDLVVFDGHRGRGIGKALVEAILRHPDLETVRRFLLATKDAHGLYAQYGFSSVECSRWMERTNTDEVWQSKF